MILKKTVLALALSLGLVTAASAVVHDLGTLTSPTTLSGFADVPVGSFEDDWKFKFDSDSFAGGSISNLSISIQGLGDLYNITGLKVLLFENNVQIFDLDANSASTVNFKTGSGLFEINKDYRFNVAGIGAGSLGGKYVYAVTALPVPEPERYAMLLAGLGLLGAVARRRMR